MTRRLLPALIGVSALFSVAIAAAAGAEVSSSQESGNPINDQGSSYHYRTYITSITPKVPGLSVEVLEFADRLLLRNGTGKTVTVYGYSGEPYARVLPNGAAEQNKRSPAVYLNTNFYADVTVPPIRQRDGAAAVGSGGSHGPVRMARPPHPLDEPGDAARGQGHLQADKDLRLDGADQGRQPAGRDQGRTVLGARELQRAHRRDRRRRPDRAARAGDRGGRQTPAGPRRGPALGRAARTSPPVRHERRGEAMPSARRGLPCSHVRRCAGLVCLLVALTHASPAFAHAQLLGTSPASGITVAAQPAEVIFQFNQNVGGTAGAVRVYNAQGDEVDNLDVSHPDGNEHWMGVGLKPHLPDGTYTGTYRVISADTHIVYGGLVFSIGHPGAAPKYTVAGPDRTQRGGAGHEDRLRGGAGARLPVDRADDRGPAVHAGGVGPGSGRPRRPRASLVAGVGRLRPTGRPAARGGGRAGSGRQRARRPAAGGHGRRRVAVELAESHGHRKHARKPLRLGVGAARTRLAGAGCAAARRPRRRQRSGSAARLV